MDETPWFRIEDERVDVEAVMEEVRRRLALRQAREQVNGGEDPEALAQRLYREMVVDRDGSGFDDQDCEILPNDYVIDWYIPILGPIHALVRRVINAEVRRYLEAGLIRQSRLNRKVLLELRALKRENQALRDRIAVLEAHTKGAGPNDSVQSG